LLDQRLFIGTSVARQVDYRFDSNPSQSWIIAAFGLGSTILSFTGLSKVLDANRREIEVAFCFGRRRRRDQKSGNKHLQQVLLSG
jgi:hypothetical protein